MRTSLLFFFSQLLTTVNVNPTLRYPSTMAIATRSSNTKEKLIGRALAAIAPSPMEHCQGQRSDRLSKSPRNRNVNPLIAELNQPRAQFNNVMEALRPAAKLTNNILPNDKLNKPCDLVPPPGKGTDPDKATKITPLLSPTGVDQQPANNNSTSTISDKDASPPTRVWISDATEMVANNTSPTATATNRRSILQSTVNITIQSSNSSVSDDNASQSKSNLKEMQDHSNL
jgi:hypothetical protein